MITVGITGQEQITAKLRGLPSKVFGEMSAEVSRLTYLLLRHVKEQKLSGQVLKNRTGTLRRKVNARIQAGDQSVVGTVGVKLSYAAAHEFGVDKEALVKEHLRTIKAAFGKPLAAPVTFLVPLHITHMKLPERSFLRSSLEDLAPEVEKGLRAALYRAMKG